MSLEAFVPCRCFQDGAVSAPPIPVEWDEASGFVSPVLPGGGEPSTEDGIAFDRWVETACAHPGFTYAGERISTWSGYNGFRHALRQAGDDQFPILTAELPDPDFGSMSSVGTKGALMELDSFEASSAHWTVATLIDDDTGEEVYRSPSTPGPSGLIAVPSRDFKVVLAQTGELVIKDSREHAVFQSRAMEQRVIATTEFGEATRVELLDVDSGTLIHLPFAIPGSQVLDKRYQIRSQPRRVHVEMRDETPARFDYILNPLRRIFEAAVLVRQPVYWQSR